jgi:hypothetical protein
MIAERFGSVLLPLRLMRQAVRLVPVVAFVLLVLMASRQSPFSFSRHDLFALLGVLVLGSILAILSYRAPRLSLRAFIGLWELKIPWLLAYLALLMVPPFVFEAVFLRRLFDGIILLPVLGAAWMFYRWFDHASWLARAFPAAFATMAVIPGFILPPYYQGIAGWTTSVQIADTVTLYGYQLVNDRGDRIWLTHTIFAPVTQVGRFPTAWADKEPVLGPLGAFIMKAYKRAYPLLLAGYMPHQRYLGELAYPSSTYATNLPDHREFPPDRIVRVQFVGLTYDRAGKVTSTKVYSDYEVPRP